MIAPKLFEIKEFHGSGYHPLIDYGSWRVAVLKFIDELLPENITSMQRHMETDEVFVLLRGQCILFIGGGNDLISDVYPQVMESEKLYNVKNSCWHTHVLSEDALVLIVENRDTGTNNSESFLLNLKLREQIIQWSKDLLVHK